MTSIWKLRGWVTSFGTFWLIKMTLTPKLKEIKYILTQKREKKNSKIKIKKKKTWKIEYIKKIKIKRPFTETVALRHYKEPTQT